MVSARRHIVFSVERRGQCRRSYRFPGTHVQPGLCTEFALHERTSQAISSVNRSVIYHDEAGKRGRSARQNAAPPPFFGLLSHAQQAACASGISLIRPNSCSSPAARMRLASKASPVRKEEGLESEVPGPIIVTGCCPPRDHCLSAPVPVI